MYCSPVSAIVLIRGRMVLTGAYGFDCCVAGERAAQVKLLKAQFDLRAALLAMDEVGAQDRVQ